MFRFVKLFDQVLLSEESLVSEFKISQPLGKSDHVTIVTDLNICKRDGSHCPTTSGSSRKGSNAIFLGKSTYEK